MKAIDFRIFGLKKTSDDFVTNLFKKSKTLQSFKDSLEQLQIFRKIDVKKCNDAVELKVQEHKLKVSVGSGMSFSHTFTPYLKIILPNLFGHGENLSFFMSTIKSLEARLAIPSINNNGLLNFFELIVSSHKKHGLLADQRTKEYALSYSTQNRYSLVYEMIENAAGLLYFRINNNNRKKLACDFKIGIFENRIFYKLDMMCKYLFTLPLNLFYKGHIRTGIIHGHVHNSDKFFLGDGIRGYTSMSIYPTISSSINGGRSCIEIANSFGYRLNQLRIFVFTDFGFCSSQSYVSETIKSSIISLFLKEKPSCLGWSSGIGVSIDMRKYQNTDVNLTMSYAIPLTNLEKTQRLQFSIDFNVL